MYEFKISKLLAKIVIDSIDKLGLDKGPFNKLYHKYENTNDKYISYQFINELGELVSETIDEDEFVKSVAMDGVHSDKLSFLKNLVFGIFSLKSIYTIQSKLVLSYLFKGVRLDILKNGRNIKLVQSVSASRVHPLFFKVYAEVYRNFPTIIGRPAAEIINLKITESTMELEISPCRRKRFLSSFSLFLKTRFAYFTAKSNYINLINDLREESDQQNYELKRLNSKLDESLKQKSVLVRALGHDINNSINTIQFSCERLIRSLEIEKNKSVVRTIAKHVEIINHISANALQNEIDDDYILNNYTIESITNIIEDLIDNFNGKIQRKKIEVLTNIDIRDDEFYINRSIFVHSILSNYFHNAIKYSYPNGRIIISVTQSGDVLDFRIIDEGKGMNVDLIEQLEGTEGETGHGQGMKIAKNLVSKMYGDVVISSELGVGTNISITMPRALTKSPSTNITH